MDKAASSSGSLTIDDIYIQDLLDELHHRLNAESKCLNKPWLIRPIPTRTLLNERSNYD